MGNFKERIYYKIDRVQGKLENESFDAKKTLEDGTSDDRLSNIFSVSKTEQSGRAKTCRHCWILFQKR